MDIIPDTITYKSYVVASKSSKTELADFTEAADLAIHIAESSKEGKVTVFRVGKGGKQKVCFWAEKTNGKVVTPRG